MTMREWSAIVESEADGRKVYTLAGREVRPGDSLELAFQQESTLRVTFEDDPHDRGAFFVAWAGVTKWGEGVPLHIRPAPGELSAVPLRWAD